MDMRQVTNIARFLHQGCRQTFKLCAVAADCSDRIFRPKLPSVPENTGTNLSITPPLTKQTGCIQPSHPSAMQAEPLADKDVRRLPGRQPHSRQQGIRRHAKSIEVFV